MYCYRKKCAYYVCLKHTSKFANFYMGPLHKKVLAALSQLKLKKKLR